MVRDSAVRDICPGAPALASPLDAWQKAGDFISRARNDRELRDQLQAASLYARNLRSRNAHCGQEEG